MDDHKESLGKIEDLLKHILAVQLYQAGASQQLIAKHLKIAKAKVNGLLKGVQRGAGPSENSKPANS